MEYTMRSIFWDENLQCVKVIDQSCLPLELRYLELHTSMDVAEAIQKMVVRGAPAIGVCAAYGMALAAEKAAIPIKINSKFICMRRVNICWQHGPQPSI